VEDLSSVRRPFLVGESLANREKRQGENGKSLPRREHAEIKGVNHFPGVRLRETCSVLGKKEICNLEKGKPVPLTTPPKKGTRPSVLKGSVKKHPLLLGEVFVLTHISVFLDEEKAGILSGKKPQAAITKKGREYEHSPLKISPLSRDNTPKRGISRKTKTDYYVKID